MNNATHMHDVHTLLTIAEIAQRFSLPESTARYYCKRFLAYLPHVGEGKRRRYRKGVLDVFAVIVDEMKRNKNAMAVEATLSATFPKNIDVLGDKPQAQQQNNNTAASTAVLPFSAHLPQEADRLFNLLEQQAMAMGTIAKALCTIAARAETMLDMAAGHTAPPVAPAAPPAVSELEQALVRKDEELETLRKEISTIKILQAESEKLHQQDLDQMRKWLGRIAQEQNTAAGRQNS
ncbi:MerR family transcriptional regulator [Desulfovibrio psychrotolerans]|uniref:HTH merR-type domain-containing protein n=1 Tax=Desulfovibrio psychrotolerans TaxID=415242 RepID=A0A7J0BZB2_9BACT|nr:MerR family transcriptional regulator [Desulfovibrio psychrotolerans]GFM38502.1 hypothetical protein DSM19430T_31860 [Desulfovibrio psychrotolerans]